MDNESLLQRLVKPLYRARGWMKLAGVMSIIQGVLSILSLWGIVVCWIPIWMGVLLCAASNRIRAAFETDSETEFQTSMEKLGTYFRLVGVLAIVMIVVAVVGLLAAIAIPAFIKARQAAMGQ